MVAVVGLFPDHKKIIIESSCLLSHSLLDLASYLVIMCHSFQVCWGGKKKFEFLFLQVSEWLQNYLLYDENFSCKEGK